MGVGPGGGGKAALTGTKPPARVRSAINQRCKGECASSARAKSFRGLDPPSTNPPHRGALAQTATLVPNSAVRRVASPRGRPHAESSDRPVLVTRAPKRRLETPTVGGIEVEARDRAAAGPQTPLLGVAPKFLDGGRQPRPPRDQPVDATPASPGGRPEPRRPSAKCARAASESVRGRPSPNRLPHARVSTRHQRRLGAATRRVPNVASDLSATTDTLSIKVILTTDIRRDSVHPDAAP